jgi:hypothetical protein
MTPASLLTLKRTFTPMKSDRTAAIAVLRPYVESLQHDGYIQFVDGFPMVTERLPGDPSSHETITKIVTAFAALPLR